MALCTILGMRFAAPPSKSDCGTMFISAFSRGTEFAFPFRTLL